MKIPQLFVKIGPNRYSPVAEPIKNKPLYFWDEKSQQIIPAENRLKMDVFESVSYFVDISGVDPRV